MTGLYARKEEIFNVDYLDKIFDHVTGSALLGRAPFTTGFVNTKGFSLIFRKKNIPMIKELFPYLSNYIDTVVFDGCNAFFINSLVLKAGSRVDDHIDCRLLNDQTTKIVPNLVSVLYVRVPPDIKGGELVLKHTPNQVIVPKTNSLVHFRGSLVHSVNEVSSSAVRMSLVCEQYNLAEEMVEHFPELKIVPGYGIA